jgi:hypothetical protein
MPLFDKKPFSLLEPPKDLDSKEKVFQIRFTKEIFRDYEYPFLYDAVAVKFAVICPGAFFANGCTRFLCLLHLQFSNLAMQVLKLVSLTTNQRIPKEAKPLSPKSLDM